MSVDIQRIKEQVLKHSDQLERVRAEVRKVLVGQDLMLSRLLIAMLTGGHVLLEGLPGLAKTTAIKGLANALRCKFNRIQFTPDLLPADLIGTMIYNPREGSFGTRKGPIFANLILADEINRAPSKVQSALLEAMQEHQVTIGDETYPLEEPFLVLATQNPIEQEGTYPLPEAQLDRFMFEILVDYPTEDEEFEIVRQTTITNNVAIEKVLSYDEWLNLQALVRRVPVADSVIRYAMQFARLTREGADKPDFIKQYVSWGAGPRASQYLVLGAKARAILHGRPYVSIEDVQAIAAPVLRHRILTNFNAEAEGIRPDDIVKKLTALIPSDGAVDRLLPKVFKTA